MSYTDKILECEGCGVDFIFTVDEQRQLTKEGKAVEDPRFCPTCRELGEPHYAPAAPKTQGSAERKFGRVKWFSDRKGYGFITQEDGEEIFVHYTGITGQGFRTLQEGQEVEFDVEDTPKGPQAVNVVKITPILSDQDFPHPAYSE
ncbi:MAG: cold shock domain-containing protein [Anaerolineae bacterium]